MLFRVKCLSVQQELHSKLQVLRCSKYVQDEIDAVQSDARAKVWHSSLGLSDVDLQYAGESAHMYWSTSNACSVTYDHAGSG